MKRPGRNSVESRAKVVGVMDKGFEWKVCQEEGLCVWPLRSSVAIQKHLRRDPAEMASFAGDGG